MPFSKKSNSVIDNSKIKKIIKKALCSLQVSRLRNVKKRQYILNKKRAFSFTSLNLSMKAWEKGSISLEAAITTTVFLLVVVPIIGLISVIDTEMDMEMSLHNAGRKMSQEIYMATQIKSIYSNNKDIDDVNNNLERNNQESLDESDVDGIKNRYLQDETDEDNTWFFTYTFLKFGEEVKKQNISLNNVVAKIAGINFRESRYYSDQGVADIVMKYYIKVPLMSQDSGMMKDKRKVKIKVWNGSDISQKKELVYITKNGTVYHTWRQCPHINIEIEKVNEAGIETLRNNSGEKYTSCNLCKNKSQESVGKVYITKYGQNYHNVISCSGISRSVIVVDKSQVEHMELCKKCSDYENASKY